MCVKGGLKDVEGNEGGGDKRVDTVHYHIHMNYICTIDPLGFVVIVKAIVDSYPETC